MGILEGNRTERNLIERLTSASTQYPNDNHALRFELNRYANQRFRHKSRERSVNDKIAREFLTVKFLKTLLFWKCP